MSKKNRLERPVGCFWRTSCVRSSLSPLINERTVRNHQTQFRRSEPRHSRRASCFYDRLRRGACAALLPARVFGTRALFFRSACPGAAHCDLLGLEWRQLALDEDAWQDAARLGFAWCATHCRVGWLRRGPPSAKASHAVRRHVRRASSPFPSALICIPRLLWPIGSEVHQGLLALGRTCRHMHSTPHEMCSRHIR